jgi:hypothetical protein
VRAPGAGVSRARGPSRVPRRPHGACTRRGTDLLPAVHAAEAGRTHPKAAGSPPRCVSLASKHLVSRAYKRELQCFSARARPPPWPLPRRAPSLLPPSHHSNHYHHRTHLPKLSELHANTHWPLTRWSRRSCARHHRASPSRLASAVTALAPAANKSQVSSHASPHSSSPTPSPEPPDFGRPRHRPWPGATLQGLQPS